MVKLASYLTVNQKLHVRIVLGEPKLWPSEWELVYLLDLKLSESRFEFGDGYQNIIESGIDRMV